MFELGRESDDDPSAGNGRTRRPLLRSPRGRPQDGVRICRAPTSGRGHSSCQIFRRPLPQAFDDQGMAPPRDDGLSANTPQRSGSRLALSSAAGWSICSLSSAALNAFSHEPARAAYTSPTGHPTSSACKVMSMGQPPCCVPHSNLELRLTQAAGVIVYNGHIGQKHANAEASNRYAADSLAPADRVRVTVI